MLEFDQIPEQALAWIADGKQAAIAIVIDTWGSAPRPVGSLLAISSDGEIAGSVSGGCVESAVVEEALEVMKDGTPRVLEFGVADDNAFAVGLACGGDIKILVEPIGIGSGPDIALIKQLVAHRADRRAVAYCVNTKNWDRQLITDTTQHADRFASEKSGFEADWFVGIHNPPLRLIVVGAVHIAQPLMQMARLVGYDATLVDPRAGFASQARFPDERLVHDWPDDALRAENLGPRTAVVTLAHDPKIDDPAIHVALNSDVFYLGCLGSSRTHAKRVDRLTKAGFSPEKIAKIHGPVGSDIGAKTPAEIAVSIMAELTERLRRVETRR
ncbi:MAG: XdhC family protein [Rhodobacteraceae bacterium]|nr:XdhC family protein [Paracoccaceae bacterium]